MQASARLRSAKRGSAVISTTTLRLLELRHTVIRPPDSLRSVEKQTPCCVLSSAELDLPALEPVKVVAAAVAVAVVLGQC